jgi:hypothetical protein
MNIEKYFKDLTKELEALKNRVRHYIDDRHWLSDGEWKESVIRTILRRHLPSNIGVGRGYVVSTEQSSTQIDVLLYDKTKPILFQDGDFIIITRDAVRGVIEVKTIIERPGKLKDAINKLSEIAQLIDPEPGCNYYKERFFGLFSYESPSFNTDNVLKTVQDCVNGQSQRIVNCISLGQDYFVRYWSTDPNSSAGFHGYNKWHSYQLENKAPAYFIHNVVDHLCPQWSNENINVWFPEDGKENHKLSEIHLSPNYPVKG